MFHKFVNSLPPLFIFIIIPNKNAKLKGQTKNPHQEYPHGMPKKIHIVNHGIMIVSKNGLGMRE